MMKASFGSRSFFFTALICLTTFACKKKQELVCGACPALYLPIQGITVKIVDKTTGDDLFFGNGAPYKISQLKLYQLVDGKPDSIFADVDSTERDFFIGVNLLHNTDTVNMQIANLSQDNLIINTSLSGPCCPIQVISSVFFDGTAVYRTSNQSQVIVLKK